MRLFVALQELSDRVQSKIKKRDNLSKRATHTGHNRNNHVAGIAHNSFSKRILLYNLLELETLKVGDFGWTNCLVTFLQSLGSR